MTKSLSISLLRWLLPILILEAYLGSTVVAYFFGPWPWPTSEPLRLFAFLILAHCLLLVGFLITYPRFCQFRRVRYRRKVILDPLLRWYSRALIVTSILIIPTALARCGMVVPDIVRGISSAGDAYNIFQEMSGSYVVVEYLRIILAPILAAFFPLTFFLWRHLSTRKKLISFAVMSYWICIYLASGTNKGIADVIITLPVFVLLALYYRGGRLRLTKNRILAIIMAGVTFFLFLSFFGGGQEGREGGVGRGGVFYDGYQLIRADRSSLLSKFLTEKQLIIYESLTRYLTHGYYALDMSMDLLDESSHTGFVGHSMFLSREANKVGDTNYFSEKSVPGLLEEKTGYPQFALWHSIYPWLFSDFGLYGTLLCMLLVGYFLGILWLEVLVRPSVVSLSGLYLMIILCVYIPANNQIFQSGEATVAALYFWFFTFLKESRMIRNFFSRKKKIRPGTI